MRYGLALPSRHEVAAELAARRLDGDVHLALGHLEALGEDLEVVDERFHRLVDAGPRRRGDLLVLDAVVAARASCRGSGARSGSTRGSRSGGWRSGRSSRRSVPTIDVEVDLVVGEVRHVAAQVPRVAGGAQDRAGGAERDAPPRAVITPTPCSRSRQIGWPVSSVSYSSSRGGISVEQARARRRASRRAGRRRRHRGGCSCGSSAGR